MQNPRAPSPAAPVGLCVFVSVCPLKPGPAGSGRPGGGSRGHQRQEPGADSVEGQARLPSSPLCPPRPSRASNTSTASCASAHRSLHTHVAPTGDAGRPKPAALCVAWGGAGGSCQLPPTSPALRSSAVLAPAPPQPIFPPISPGGGGKAVLLPCCRPAAVAVGPPAAEADRMHGGGGGGRQATPAPHCPATRQQCPRMPRRLPTRSRKPPPPPPGGGWPPRRSRLSGPAAEMRPSTSGRFAPHSQPVDLLRPPLALPRARRSP